MLIFVFCCFFKMIDTIILTCITVVFLLQNKTKPFGENVSAWIVHGRIESEGLDPDLNVIHSVLLGLVTEGKYSMAIRISKIQIALWQNKLVHTLRCKVILSQSTDHPSHSNWVVRHWWSIYLFKLYYALYLHTTLILGRSSPAVTRMILCISKWSE